jgi:hypothetical protein
MKSIKKLMGLVWMIAAPVLTWFLVSGAIQNIDSNGTKDINKPIPWAIIILVFTPIAAGLMIFGYYCFKGEYDRLPASSEELE